MPQDAHRQQNLVPSYGDRLTFSPSYYSYTLSPIFCHEFPIVFEHSCSCFGKKKYQQVEGLVGGVGGRRCAMSHNPLIDNV